jgi:hypothetical protein
MAAKQLSDGNTDGVSLGQSATDLVGFYGTTPVVRPTLATIATAATLGTVRTAVQAIIAHLKALGLAT